jgi:hypothetical protein
MQTLNGYLYALNLILLSLWNRIVYIETSTQRKLKKTGKQTVVENCAPYEAAVAVLTVQFVPHRKQRHRPHFAPKEHYYF